LDPVINPVSGWRGRVPTWFGIPCRIGRVTLWLPVEGRGAVFRNFSLLVLLPREELEGAPPFILLGTQFFLEYKSKVLLDFFSIENPGGLIVP
jgi:hypothetical protein